MDEEDQSVPARLLARLDALGLELARRGDAIALLTRINELRSSMAAVMSMWMSAQFQELSLPPAELRREFLADREPAMEVIVARAMARGELGPKTPPARVISLAPDLLRHEQAVLAAGDQQAAVRCEGAAAGPALVGKTAQQPASGRVPQFDRAVLLR